MQTAYDLIWMAAERTPEHLALVDDRTARSLSYRALIAEADTVAAGLWQRGVRPGDRVATILPNLFEHAIGLIALARIGAVPALLNFRLQPQQLAGMIRQGRMRGAIIRNDPELAATLAAELSPGSVMLCVGGATPQCGDFAACRASPSILPERPKPAGEDPAFIFYTSGTTGTPKGAMIPHRASEHRLAWMAPCVGLRCGPHLRTLGIAPLFHAIGFYGVFLNTLAFNGTYYTMSAFDPSTAINLVEEHQINFLFAVPTLYQALVAAPGYLPERMRSVELVLYGGAPILPALLDRLEREWPAIIRHAYGTTEIMTGLYQPEPSGQPRTLRPCYGTRMRVVQIGGGPEDLAKPGVAGELVMDATTDSMFTGYLGMPEATAQKLRDGWYFTGDVCISLGNGDVELVGRVDDMIRSGGESIYPEEIEVILSAHPGVRESCVVGVPDRLWGETVVACVVPCTPGMTADQLDKHCRTSALATFKRPRAYVFMDALPRNASNKVLRRVLREQLVAGSKTSGGDLQLAAG